MKSLLMVKELDVWSVEQTLEREPRSREESPLELVF
jgi:hypothetical protein